MLQESVAVGQEACEAEYLRWGTAEGYLEHK